MQVAIRWAGIGRVAVAWPVAAVGGRGDPVLTVAAWSLRAGCRGPAISEVCPWELRSNDL
eukprot:13821186-Heterocapsa_arctica.AAC.1